MQQNYSQRLEMQIPQENTYIGISDRPNIEVELEKLSLNYSLRKINELKEYLEKNQRLIPYIHYITPIIKKYFPNKKIYLTYCTDPEFDELNIAKICIIGNDSLFEEEYDLMTALDNQLLNSNEFPVEVKSLISVNLWWL